jgi:hypothetical protein
MQAVPVAQPARVVAPVERVEAAVPAEPALVEQVAPTNSLYDQDALQAYLQRAKASGATPEFTNIPGASGFMVNSNVGGVAKPIPPSSVDGKMPEMKEPAAYTDLQSVLNAKTELKLSNETALRDRLTAIAQEEGVPQLEAQMAQMLQWGYAGQPEHKRLSDQLNVAKFKAASRLAIGAKGEVIGVEATPFFRANQMLELYTRRAEELASGASTEAKRTALQVQLGLKPATLNRIESVVGPLDLATIGTLDPNTIAVADKLASNKRLDLGEVLGAYPKALDFYLGDIQKNKTPDEVATISSIAIRWRDRLDKAAELAVARAQNAKDGAYATAKRTGDIKALEGIIAATEATARNEELNKAKNEVITDWVTPAKLDPSTLVGVTERQREMAIKARDALVKNYGDSLPTGWLSSINMNDYFELQGISGLEVKEARILVRRMMVNMKDSFNAQYSDTLGATITSETPQFKFWGI